MNIEILVNDAFEIPLHEGTYKMPTDLKQGQMFVFVSDMGGGQDVFDHHREKFLKRILSKIVQRKPKVQDYIKFDNHALNGKDVVFYDRIAWGEISYKLVSRYPLRCEFMFTEYLAPQEPELF